VSRQTPKQYAIVVSDIDDLVADVLRTSSWNPGVFMGTNQTALEAIKRQKPREVSHHGNECSPLIVLQVRERNTNDPST
jgi:hypothetical protein